MHFSLFIMYVYVSLGECVPLSVETRRVLDYLELELQAVVSFLVWIWELNSDSLEKQQMLLTTEPSL